MAETPEEKASRLAELSGTFKDAFKAALTEFRSETEEEAAKAAAAKAEGETGDSQPKRSFTDWLLGG